MLPLFLTLLALAAPPDDDGDTDTVVDHAPSLDLDTSGKVEGVLPRYTDTPRTTCCPARELIQAPLRDAIDDFRACVPVDEDAPDAPAVRITFTIFVDGQTGTPTEVRTRGAHPSLDCLRDTAMAIRWPGVPCSEGWSVAWPLLLPAISPDRSRSSPPGRSPRR